MPTPTEAVPTPTASPSPVLDVLEKWRYPIDVGEWQAICMGGVVVGDCKGVAKLFINNLARNWHSVFEQSGGHLSVAARPQCPSAIPDWADPTSCWQAMAPVSDGDVCMIIARGPSSLGFGQVGGDDMTGRAVYPESWEPCA
jgi:hypothetical protein